MYKLNKIISFTAIIGTLLAGPKPMFARSSANAPDIVNESVTWTLTAGICPSLPSTLSLSGIGERHKVSTAKVNADGSTQVIINDLVIGTATDNQGGSYRFKYTNHSIDISKANGIHQISMEDSFVMNGKGSADHMNIGFKWDWTYSSPSGPFDVLPLANLVEYSTRNTPLLCDPL